MASGRPLGETRGAMAGYSPGGSKSPRLGAGLPSLHATAVSTTAGTRMVSLGNGASGEPVYGTGEHFWGFKPSEPPTARPTPRYQGHRSPRSTRLEASTTNTWRRPEQQRCSTAPSGAGRPKAGAQIMESIERELQIQGLD